jgi:arylsulfatase A-like enzyme
VTDLSRLSGARLFACALLVAVLNLAAVAQTGPPASREPAPAPRGSAHRPRLAVVIVVDGLSWPRLAHYRPWFTAGLKRLLDEGHVFTNAHYQHINTETSPGHASLATGAPPRVTGVVANRWLTRLPDGSMRSVYSTEMIVPPAVAGDPPGFYREVEKDGRVYAFATGREFETWQASGETGRAIVRLGAGPNGESVVFDGEDAIAAFNQRHGRPAEPLPARAVLTGPGHLRVDTLGDRLVAASPASRVVAVSGKDRASVMMAGRSAGHVAYWYDQETGRFVTSPYYASYTAAGAAARDLVTRYNREKAGASLLARFGTTWQALPPSGPVRPDLPLPAPQLLEFQTPTNGLGFPHDLTFGPRGYFTGVYYSPLVDAMVGELAAELVADDRLGLGQGTATDILWVSFSAQDTVSHSYGPESAENLDVLRRLDLQLGTLFDTLARRGFSREDVVLAFSADHGFADLPEPSRLRNPDYGGGRLLDGDRVYPTFYQRLNRLVSEALCLPTGSRPIFGGEGWSLSYNHPALPMRTVEGACGPAGRAVGSAEIDRVLPGIVHASFQEEIETTLLATQRASWKKDDPLAVFALNDFDAERSGDAFLVPRFGVLMTADAARGTGHGSHHEYDTHVPLIFWGGAWRAGAAADAVTPYDLAPTLAAALRISLPDATGCHLAEGERD